MTAPWSATIRERTLVVALPVPYRVLSWAPLGGGLIEARAIINHYVRADEYPPAHEPQVFLRALAQRLDLQPQVVGLMTGVKMEHLVRRIVQHNSVTIEC